VRVRNTARGEICVTEWACEIAVKERSFPSAKIESVLEWRLWSLRESEAAGENTLRDKECRSIKDEGTVEGVDRRGEEWAGASANASAFDNGVKLPNGMNTLGWNNRVSNRV
jgi:hypothetical protein